jgi:hypothetical protein
MKRGGFLLIYLVLTLIASCVLSGGMVVETLFRFLTDGPVLLAWCVACVGVGLPLARSIAKGVMDHIAIAFAIGVGAVALLALSLGWLGLLNTYTACLVMLVGGVVGAVSLRNIRRLDVEAWLKTRVEPGQYSLLIAVAPLAVMLTGGLILPGILWGDEPHGYDVVSYHLQLPREWFEQGHIAVAPHNVFSFFPFNVEMHYLLAMHLRGGPWAGMYVAQWMHGVMAVMTAIAIYASLRDRGSFIASAASVLLLSVPFVPMLGSVAYNEMGLMLFAAVAIRVAMTGSAALSGLMCGFAIGCKLTAVPMVAVPALVVLIAQRTGFRSVMWFAMFASLASSPWLIRNAITTGNPVFPLMSKQLGGPFDQAQIERFDVAHAPTLTQQSLAGKVHAFLNQVMWDWKWSGVALVALLLIATVLNRDWRNASSLWAGLLVIVLTWLFATHLQGRFFVVALPIVVMLICGATWKGWPVVLLVSSVLLIARGHDMFTRVIDRQPFIGFEAVEQLPDLTFGQGVGERLLKSDKPVVLIGDARAFWLPVPSSRLRYTTVFDIRDWPTIEPGHIYLINPGEMERFHKTYRRLPDVPGEWVGRPPFVIE